MIKPPEVISVLDNGTSLDIDNKGMRGLTELNSLNSTSKLPTKVATTRNDDEARLNHAIMDYENSIQDGGE